MATYLGIELHDDDPHYLNEFSTTLLNDFYIKDGETIKQRFATPAAAFSYGDKAFAQRIYDYVHKGWFVYSSPVNSNAPAIEWPQQMTVGSEYARQWLRANVDSKHKGMPISCFLSYVPDTIDGQIESDKELAYMSIIGGGVGKHLQMRGVTDKSPGAIPYVCKDDGAIQYFKQGKTRKGSVAHYLDVSHPDIQEFINIRVPTGGDINRKAFNVHNAVNINYAFLDAVKRGDDWNLINPHNGEVTDTVSARELWQQILEARYRTGEPYINNVEEANRKLPEAQQVIGLAVHGSNLCVAPETQILTDNGYVPIAELEGEIVNVWNGDEWSEVAVCKTGENQKLLRITTSSGEELECTPYHKFYVFNGYGKPYIEKRAHELEHGDKLAKFDLPIVDGSKALENAYINGFYSGDGCLTKNGQRVYLYHEKRKLEHLFDGGGDWIVQDGFNRQYKHYRNLKDKFFVPSSDYDIQSRLDWLAGWLDSDGCVYRNGTNEAIVASSVEREFLREVQLMLQTLGVSAKLNKNADAGYRLLPANDGTGELKEFWCQDSWRICITSNDSYKLLCMGLNLRRLDIKKRKPQRDAKQFNKVVSVTDEGRIDDTYCFTEHKRHMGMFNGILTGNCDEIHLPTDEQRSAVCCLSSVNLALFDEWRDDPLFIEDCVRFLDNVLQFFIDIAPKGLEKAVYSATQERAIGLGMLGWHTLLQRKSITWESGGFGSAIQLCNQTAKHIKQDAVAASEKLAGERGEAPDMIGTGRRNSHLMAVAPNANSGIIAGVSASIEPIRANCYTHRTRAGSFLVRNAELERVLRAHNDSDEWLDEQWASIMQHNGSVQHLEYLTDHERAVFKTALEIDQLWVVEHARIRQAHICQGQSVNLFFPAGTDKTTFNRVHLAAFSEDGSGAPLKGLYYCRTEAKQKADQVSVKVERKALADYATQERNDTSATDGSEECLSCQG